jgi:hypothetical protein
MFRQYMLRSGSQAMVGWLDTPARLKLGQHLTTKEHGPERIWVIVKAGRVELKEPPDRRWQVGGLM